MRTPSLQWMLLGLILSIALPSAAAESGALNQLLHSTLEDLQRGSPNLSKMEPLTAAAVQQQMGVMRPILEQMGKIRSLSFLGIQTMPGGAGEAYRVTFERGTMLWVISESSAGKIQILWTQGPEGTPPASR